MNTTYINSGTQYDVYVAHFIYISSVCVRVRVCVLCFRFKMTWKESISKGKKNNVRKKQVLVMKHFDNAFWWKSER